MYIVFHVYLFTVNRDAAIAVNLDFFFSTSVPLDFTVVLL